MLTGEAEALTRRAAELALAGDTTAMRLCLERIVPPQKDRPVIFALPPLEAPAHAVNATAALPSFWMLPLSQFVYQLRRAGVVIDTIRTNEPGTQGLRLRYVLRSEIIVTAVELIYGTAMRNNTSPRAFPCAGTGEVERLWHDYIELRAKAGQSQNIQDGIAAGQAWGRFVRAFESPKMRNNGGGS